MQLTQILCLLLLVLIVPVWLAAQQAPVIRTNIRGERVIVYPDGRTTYLNGEPASAAEGASYPVYTADIAPLDGPVSITEEDVYKIAVRRSQLAKDAAALAEERSQEAVANRERLEAALAALQGSDDEETLTLLERRLQLAKRTEMESQVEARRARQLAAEADSITSRSGYIDDFNRRMSARQQLSDRVEVNQGNQRSVAALQPRSSLFKGWAAGKNLIFEPPTKPCGIAFEGRDPQDRQYRKELKPQLLFTHTDERLRPYLKEKEYMKCEGFMHRMGGFTFLTLQFTFAYPNAREAYGLIEKNSILSIRLLNGTYILLRSGQLAQGTYDRDREILTYRVYYPIDRDDLPLMRHSEVDQIRVFWSSGYEEYQVRQLDFFQRQLECLEG